MADRFAVGIGAGKTWTNADTSLWSATSGGASGASVPGASDVAIFDANSGGTGAYRVSLNYSPTLSGITLDGISASVKLFLGSSVRGTQRTITAGTVTSGANCILQDLVGAGAGSWDLSAVISGDGGGNSGITFKTGANMFVTGTGARSFSTLTWSTTTGGAADGRVPLPQDTAKIDANSGTGTLTQDLPYLSAVDFTGSSGITWTTSTAASFFGSINLTGLATLTASSQAYTYEGRGSSTLTSAGKTWAKTLSIDCATGTLTLGDAFTSSLGLQTPSGSFNAGGFNVTVLSVSGNYTTARSITMGSGTWTLSSPGNTTAWFLGTTNLTFDAGTSTIRLVGDLTGGALTFAGQGLTYYRLENATTAANALKFTGSGNVFQDGIYVDASAAARTVQFTAGTTTTVGTFGRLDATTNMITIDSITAANHALVKSGGGVISGLDYLTVGHSDASPALTWYAGANSTDSGTNSGWIFTAPPSGGGAGALTLLGVG